MSGGISKRVGLFLLIFGVPLIFLYVLARGETNTQKLKFYGEEITKEGKFKINDFIFYDADSNAITKETLKGKSIIFSILIPSCPSKCPIISGQLGNFVYNKIKAEKRLKDFIIVSQLLDTSGKEVDLKSFIQEQPVDQDWWKILRAEENTIYDFELPNANLLDDNLKDRVIGGKTFYKMILLVDRNHYLRGIYQGDKTMEIERLNQEIRVLEREYAVIDKKENIQK